MNLANEIIGLSINDAVKFLNNNGIGYRMVSSEQDSSNTVLLIVNQGFVVGISQNTNRTEKPNLFPETETKHVKN